MPRHTASEFYYHGYAYEGESFYDYKKRFSATEEFDWRGRWQPPGCDLGDEPYGEAFEVAFAKFEACGITIFCRVSV